MYPHKLAVVYAINFMESQLVEVKRLTPELLLAPLNFDKLTVVYTTSDGN